MPESKSQVPQAGIDFIRDLALDDMIDSLFVRTGAYHSGESLFEKSGKKRAWICEFVMEPGPNAKRVVLTEQAGDRHPVIAAVHKAVSVTEDHRHSLDPHHTFAPEGEALTPHDAVTAIIQLAEMAGFRSSF